MIKIPVKCQKDRYKSVGGVALTRFPLQKCEEVGEKNNFRILYKAHAHLQIMMKTLVKFQKDLLKTVGGDALINTYYKLGTTHHGKPNTMSPRFSSKRRGTIKLPRPCIVSASTLSC